MRRTSRLAKAAATSVAAVAMLVVFPATALAEPPPALPASAPAADLAHQPALDYDTDGCYPTPAIGPTGTLNPGLAPGGALNGRCRDAADLDNTNAYSRSLCNNGWCAYMYTYYFEKDQATAGPIAIGHRHDWEHIVVWVQGDWGRYVSTSAHGKYTTRHRDAIPWDETGKHPKVVYHKDGISTHCFRHASHTEPPENHKGAWQYPALVGWDNYPPDIRDRLTGHDFGSATMGIRDQGDKFRNELAKAKPSGIPFDPWA